RHHFQRCVSLLRKSSSPFSPAAPQPALPKLLNTCQNFRPHPPVIVTAHFATMKFTPLTSTVPDILARIVAKKRDDLALAAPLPPRRPRSRPRRSAAPRHPQRLHHPPRPDPRSRRPRCRRHPSYSRHPH